LTLVSFHITIAAVNLKQVYFRRFFQKTCSLLANFSLFLNLFLPYLSTQPAFAEEPLPTPTPIVENAQTGVDEVDTPAEPTAIPTTEPVVTPVITETPTITPEPTAVPTGVDEVDTPAEPTTIPTEAPTITLTITPEPTAVPTGMNEVDTPAEPTAVPTGVDEVDTPEPVNTDIGTQTPTIETTVTPTEIPVVEKVCLTGGEIIEDTINENWIINDTTGISETKENVKLGVRYVYPQENKVTITFKCLPADESLRTPLKIQKVKTSDLNLPDDIGNIGEYAYDITTGMANSTFEYDVTLPKPSDSTAEVSYIEKSIDDATTNEIKVDEIKPVEENKLEQSGDTVKAIELDHFTLFIISNGAVLSVSGSFNGVTQVTVTPNTTIEVDLTVERSGGSIFNLDENDWGSSSWRIDGGDWVCNNHADHTFLNGTSSESFSITAPVTEGTYDVSFKAHRNDSCGSTGESNVFTLNDGIIVVEDTPINPTVCNDPLDNYSLNSSSGIWTDVDGGSNVNGEDTNEIRWGTTQGEQSGLRFDAVGVQTFNENTKFLLGTLTHMNWPIGGGSAANGATLQITLSFSEPAISPNPAFTFDFDIEETPNDGNCDYGGNCNDKITFPVSYGTQVFTIGDIKYTLVIDGFVDSYTCGGIGNIVNHFITEEQKNNSAFLIGHLSSELVPAPAINIEKKTNNIDVTALPGPELNTGDSVTWQYIVQNIGNVDLNNIAVVDDKVDAINCPYSSLPASAIPSERIMTCTATGTVVAGQYTNTATVTANHTNGAVSDSDSSWYFGVPRNVCGDGVVNQDSEQCDNGSNNNGSTCTPAYGNSCSYCSASCQNVTLTGPYCGDGIINGSETCDGSNLGSYSSTDFQCNNCSIELKQPKVTICHSSSSHSNPYTSIQPNKNGTVDGHISDNGPVWYPGITVKWGDIIPPFAYIGGTFPGLNWTTEGQNIYNNDCNLPKGTLIVKKVLTNDNGSTKVFSNFSFNIGATTYIFDNDGQNDLSVTPGKYTITENTAVGYTTTYNNCSNITVPVSGSATCTITNNDVAPKLTVVKTVKNDNGGTKLVSDFKLYIDGTAATSGTAYNVLANKEITVSEDPLTGYAPSDWGGDCSKDGKITLLPGDSKTCTITNDDIAPSLTLNKVVVNNNGGTAPESAWTLTANGGTAGTLSGAGDTGSTDVVSGASFKAGTYALSESAGPAGYTASSWNCVGGTMPDTTHITLTIGQSATCTLTNDDQQASIVVVKTVVNDNGGTAAPNDFNLTIGGTAVSSGQTLPVIPGTYTAGETNLLGYTFTGFSGDCDSNGAVTVALGQTKTCTLTNDDVAPKLTLTKDPTNDNGGNALPDDFLLTIGGTAATSGTAYTLKANTPYAINETQLTGYEFVSITGNAKCPAALGGTVTLAPGDDITCTITNDDIYGKINVTKFNDLDGDGIMNNNDVGLSGWTINLSGETKATNENGQITFGQLIPNTYYLSEVLQPGWTQTNIYCDQEEEVFTKVPDTILNKIIKTVNAQVAGYPVRVSESQSVNCYIGNRLLPPTATISKSNDASGDLSPGDSVNFKIIVIISGNDINDFKVTDLPPNGFSYRPASYNVLKNGDTYAITEPVYHSPGVWNLGNLKVGDTLVLTYTADISSDQQPGTYRDLAYAYGQAAYGDNVIVYADGENSQYVSNNFVGTEVPIVKSTQNSVSAGVEKEEVQGEVLGASTELPSTGANTIWLIISGLMFIIGLAFIKKSSMKLIAIIFLAILSLFVPSAQALDSLSVRLEQPKSPANLNDLKLTFVALDINNNAITVKCYKKGPSDSSYTQFGSDISLAAPGNTSQCQTNSSILSSEGTYNFYVTANNEQSNIVSLDYKTSGPGTPSNYRKEWLNSGCDYKIHFKTADDEGKTVKVELYRADITDFILDNGSRVASVNIGSNQESSITNSVPDCSKSYYYVLRAFDDAGNGSGTIGDSVTITTTSTTIGTTTTTTGAIPVTNATLAPEEEENTLLTGTPSPEEFTTSNEEGTVLGTVDTVKSFLQKSWLPLLLGLIGLFAIIRYVLSKKKKSTHR